MTFTPSQIREKRSDFWESKFHKHLIPCSLVASTENKSVLFNVAGMQQLVPYLVGKSHPQGKRLYNIQKCIRTNDLEDIGDERHCSTFEMMGNRSLGDYFKKEAIVRSIEFLVKVMDLDIDKIGATIFAGDEKRSIPRDDESWEVLNQVGIKNIKEVGFDEAGESDNFWTPGPIGPCGPCVEFYYDRGDPYGPSDRDMGVNDRYTEVWNNVLMSYYRDGGGDIRPLAQKNVDTGMGFERLNMVLQNTETIFETPVFLPYIDLLSSYSDKKYEQATKSYRIILDHMRSATFLVGDGVLPSNEGRGYVLRRIIRRMYYNVRSIGIDFMRWQSLLEKYVSSLCNEYKKYYDNLDDDKKIIGIIEKESIAFENTIHNGIAEFGKLAQQGHLDNKNVFKLFDTYGLPRDIINDLAMEKGYKLDKTGFEDELEKARELSKQNSGFIKNIERSKYIAGVKETKFLGYDYLDITNTSLLKDFVTDEGQRVLIFDQTPFYATGGGQVGDSGLIVLDDGSTLKVKEVIKYAGVYLHLIDQDG